MGAPNAIDLTYLQAVKDRAQVVSSDQDKSIQDAITGFSQWLLNFCDTATLNSIVTVDEYYNGNGNARLFLRTQPARTLNTVEIVGGPAYPISSGANWGVYIEDSKKSIALRGNGGTGIRTVNGWASSTTFGRWGGQCQGPIFPSGMGNIHANYDAGFLPRTVTGEVATITNSAVTVQVAPWTADVAVVFYPSLAPLTKVASAPATGQYALAGNGVYVFAVADETKQVQLSYTVNAAPFDLEYAVRCCVAINYKRASWQDVKSKGVSTGSSGSSTTTYQNWEYPPEYMKVFELYQRNSYQF